MLFLSLIIENTSAIYCSLLILSEILWFHVQGNMHFTGEPYLLILLAKRYPYIILILNVLNLFFFIDIFALTKYYLSIVKNFYYII